MELTLFLKKPCLHLEVIDFPASETPIMKHACMHTQVNIILSLFNPITNLKGMY